MTTQGNSIAVDPQNVITAYQQKLTEMTHDAMVAQAAVNQLSSDLSLANDQLAQREAEIARLTAVPEHAEQIAPDYSQQDPAQPAQWGEMSTTSQ